MKAACVRTLVALLPTPAACSWQQLYDGARTAQRQQCQRIDDRVERRRCEQEAAMSYEAYSREAARQR